MILSDKLIIEANHKGYIKIEPFEEEQVQPASYDLRVGSEAAVSSERKKIDVEKQGFIELSPGDFAVIITHEIIEFDNQHVARFGLCSKWARKGIVATTGTQIDPGFKGRLGVGLTNLSSKKIALSHRDDFLTVEFHKLSQPANEIYSGPYQGKYSLGESDWEAVLDREVMSISEITQTLRSLTSNVEILSSKIEHIDKELKLLKWLIGIGIVIIGTGFAIISLMIAIFA